jgi:hypothetical protein
MEGTSNSKRAKPRDLAIFSISNGFRTYIIKPQKKELDGKIETFHSNYIYIKRMEGTLAVPSLYIKR